MDERITSELEYHMLAETDAQHLLVEVLSRLPSSIREKVLDDENGLFFYVTNSDESGGGASVNLPDSAKTVIWFDERSLILNEQKAKHLIAHEIAHYVLGHKVPAEKDMEREAENLVRRWGFGQKG